MIEPFGYFRAEPFGWTDCSETDEGAVPLYEQDSIDELIKQRDDLLDAAELLREVIIKKNRAGADWGNLFSDVMVAIEMANHAIARVKGNHIEHQLNMVTSAPAIVFYPSGSLGEPVESEGGEA